MKKRKVKSKHKPPSRIRYEKKNPVFSVRMPQEYHDDYKAYAKKMKLSRRKFMARALKIEIANYEKARREGFKEGHTLGITQGKNIGKSEWVIRFPCPYCRGFVEVPPNSSCHDAIMEFLKEKGWAHQQCPVD